ncbi:MAG TPA: 1-(5-phosphoribosyl)-5-[(5-phosphoribosylamino)methylideneamino]imidazole-4-carboxamide isomerase [Chloroflexota bacterium]|nr:1-(5-phosphoribosyl)-5-[(5-phosphoribosylamino)methylideneamino]imidazole-4-carboxamide isomerase [Chloroflexota bacterium]
MLLIPALDLLGGKCVRLRQGNYDQATEYSGNPLEVAKHWQDTGAEWLHIVDLDGARSGAPRHLDLVRAIRSETAGLRLELGGGLRSMDVIEQALEVADRVVLGTAAVKDPALVRAAVARFGAAIAVGIDARQGLVAIDGWESETTRPSYDVAGEMKTAGVQTIVFTDIETDGTLEGPNLNALAAMRGVEGVTLIASGGVASIAHLRQIAKLGVDACIIGKALYDGAIDLVQAMHETGDETERYEW